MKIAVDANSSQLLHWWFDGAVWELEDRGSDHVLEPGSSLSSVSWAAGRLDIFGLCPLLVVLNTEQQLIHWWFDGGWGAHADLLGGNLVTVPSAVSWAAGRLDVAGLTAYSVAFGELGHWWYDNENGWGLGGAPEYLAGTDTDTLLALATAPSAVS